VLVEKPLATSVEDCDRLAEAAARHDVRVGVNHSLLCDPWVARLRRLVAAGRIGEVVSAEYVCTAEYAPWAGGPVPPQYRDGGHPFRDLGVHGLYLLQDVLGPIESLHVERESRGGDPNLAFDEWQALVRCARGTGRIRLSWNARPLETYFAVHGLGGTLRADVGRLFLGRRLARPLPGPIGRTVNTIEDALAALVAVPRSAVGLATGRLRPYAGLRAAVAAFHRALVEGSPLPASLEDGREVVRWVEEGARPADLAKRHAAWRRAPRARGVVLVTGAAGYLGGALVDRLVADGERVRALVRRERDEPRLRQRGAEVVVGDLGDAAAVAQAVAGARLVHHAGAAMGGGREEHERGTIAGTGLVVDACVAERVRLVHVSSLSVLHWAGFADGARVTEEAALEPAPWARGNYTRAKLAAECLVRDAVVSHGLDAVIVRPGQIVGPGRFGPGTVDGVRAGRFLVVLGDRASILPLVHVDDVVEALVRAARATVPSGAVYHVVDECLVTREALARRIAAGARVFCVPSTMLAGLGLVGEVVGRVLRREPPLSRYRVRSTAARVRFDCGRAARELGWRPNAGTLTPASAADRGSGSAAAATAPAADTATASRAPDAAPAAAAR
jgi:nucleoside-diphosphate-sugar epimerase/predicted dehydrogenase